jgi:hypothetical protein
MGAENLAPTGIRSPDRPAHSQSEHLCSIVIKQPAKASRKYQEFKNVFIDLPQHVSASHCHHQGVVVSSEATQAVYIVDVYGLRPVQSGQLAWDVTKCGKSINALIKSCYFIDAIVGCFITSRIIV